MTLAAVIRFVFAYAFAIFSLCTRYFETLAKTGQILQWERFA